MASGGSRYVRLANYRKGITVADELSGPYASSARQYHEAGWPNPLPLEGKGRGPRETPVPAGYTGASARSVTPIARDRWMARQGKLNIALRLPTTIIGIDVDHYDEKCGADTIARAKAQLGPLPDTIRSSARDPEGPSGIYFYAVPFGTSMDGAERRLRERFGPDVEIIHAGHRYTVVWPSVHPDTGRVYRWYGGTDPIPAMSEAQELPGAWLAFLAGPPLEVSHAGASELPWDEPSSAGTKTRAAAKALLKREVTAFERLTESGSGRTNRLAGLALLAGHGVPEVWNAEAVAARLEQACARNGFTQTHGERYARQQIENGVRDGAENPWEIVEEKKPVEVQDIDDIFTDARMAGVVAEKALKDSYRYTEGLGWLHWQGTHWHPVTEALVTETVRQFMIRMQVEAIDEDKKKILKGENITGKDANGWRKYQAASLLAAVTKLARGVETVFADASEFDTDPDLLNTPSCVLNLKTGEMSEHDPKYLITKITDVKYVPGAESVYVKAALSAVPHDSLEWLQLMLGKAATGYSPDQLVLLTGKGRNGKTALMGAVYRVLGSYAAKVPNTLLLKGGQKGSATPEKMSLRGTRLAYMEETPEEGYLDAQVTKDLVEAEVVDGRALYKMGVTWTPTHSIFLNTNHAPIVTDTGDGTWRRLARVDFPLRYRKKGEPIENENDRPGDPLLKPNLRTAAAREALLAWIVAGAARSYAEGEVALPASVAAGVQRWREASDDVMRFLGERCTIMGPEHGVIWEELYREYADWAKRNGCRPMSSRELAKRLDRHSALPRYVVKKQVVATSITISRAWENRPGWIIGDGFVGQDPPEVPKRPWVVIGITFA